MRKKHLMALPAACMALIASGAYAAQCSAPPQCIGAGKALQWDQANFSFVCSQTQGGTVRAGNCSGTYDGGFCDTEFYVDVVFPTPYAYTPTVTAAFAHVSGAAPGEGGSGCLQNAIDTAIVRVSDVTPTKFRLWASVSPMTGSCGSYNGWSYPAYASWTAF